MNSNSEHQNCNNALKGLTEALNVDASVIEAVAAGIIVAQNLNNMGRPIDLNNIGSILSSNFQNQIYRDGKPSFNFNQNPRSSNLNWVDEYFSGKLNKRVKKEYSHQMQDENFRNEFSSPLMSGSYDSSISRRWSLPSYPYQQHLNSESSFLNSSLVKQEEEAENKREQEAPLEEKPVRKRKNGKKKSVIKKHKPASNSKVIVEQYNHSQKADSKPRTEIWSWRRIQELASKDDILSRNRQRNERGEFIMMSCSLCMATFEDESCISNLSWGHIYHLRCLVNQCKKYISRFQYPEFCPTMGCEKRLGPQEITKHLEQDEFIRFEAFALLRSGQMNRKKLGWCGDWRFIFSCNNKNELRCLKCRDSSYTFQEALSFLDLDSKNFVFNF